MMHYIDYDPETGIGREFRPLERADLVEVVRCKDCEFSVDGGKYCAEGCIDSWDWRNVEPNGFCSWGERK